MSTLKPPFRANDMNGLFKRVLKGVYPKIPGNYSAELTNMIKQLLQVESAIRPTCDQILAMESVKKRLGSSKNLPLETADDLYEQMNLLNTIKLPKNLAHITKDLPKSNKKL
jgi:NIMA (never in mitosis gene a)-related kinase